MEKKIAVIGAILENPKNSQSEFNKIVSDYKKIVRGRMGIPLLDHNMTVISITCLATMDEINALTGKLGSISGITVTTAISKKTINE